MSSEKTATVEKPSPVNNGAAARELIERIDANGPVTVAEYMGVAAAHYYASRDPFGTGGDFTTAPEISQMFGEMVGAWFVDIWLQMGQPERVQLIELGPGRGTLMADIMRTLSSWPALKAAVSVHMVETSPHLRQIQSATLAKYAQPTWYDSLDEVPEGISFIVANEFFDALPVHQFKKTKAGWKERGIDYDAVDGQFKFTLLDAPVDIPSVMPEDFVNAEEGSIFEISPASLSIAEEIAARIDAQGGAALLIDYGYAVPALGDTLQSLYRQRYADVLENPGEADITAHVDFATLKTVASQSATVWGAVTQGEFLNRLGIVARAETLSASATEAQSRDISLALYRLTAGAEMGRLFKVMGITPRDAQIIPAGFADDADAAHDLDDTNDMADEIPDHKN